VIRLAEASDSSALISLIERYWEFEQIEGFNPARTTNLLADLFHAPHRGQIWLAQDGGLRVGYLIAAYLFTRGLRFYEQHGFDSLSGYRLLNKSLRP